MSRAGIKSNRKLILVLIQERTLLLVSGHIESSTFSLSLVSCSFSLAFSLVLLPSFLLSLSPSGSRLPSFLRSLSCNTFVGQMHSEHNHHIQPLLCVFVLSWDLVRICICANYLLLDRDLSSSNMLKAAISVFALQARHVRARFECPGMLPSHSSLIWESHNVQREAGLLSLLLRLSGTLSAPSSASDVSPGPRWPWLLWSLSAAGGSSRGKYSIGASSSEEVLLQ